MPPSKQPSYDFVVPGSTVSAPVKVSPATASAGGRSVVPLPQPDSIGAGSEGRWAYCTPQSGSWTPARRRGIPGWAIALIALGTVLLLAIGAGVAIPAYLAHRAQAEWSATSVRVPSEVAGHRRLKSKAAATAVKALTTGGLTAKQVAVYDLRSAHLVILIAAKPAAPLSSGDVEGQRAAMERMFATSSGGATLRLIQVGDPGPLGGYLGCGTTSTGKLSVCLGIDAGSIVALVTGPDVRNPLAVMRAARAAAVHRS